MNRKIALLILALSTIPVAKAATAAEVHTSQNPSAIVAQRDSRDNRNLPNIVASLCRVNLTVVKQREEFGFPDTGNQASSALDANGSRGIGKSDARSLQSSSLSRRGFQ